jgi:cytochrome P450
MAIWFGSVHILSTTIVYVIQDLCLHPEYIEPIRRELETSYADFERTGQGLPLLDSFMKESARLTPVESSEYVQSSPFFILTISLVSVRRCALQPFTLSDGTKLNVGDWACAASGAINTSAEHFPSPNNFSGFRFADPALVDSISGPHGAQQPTPSKFTDVHHSYLMWGTGRMAW